MNTTVLDVIIVGAGQAGLSASYHLKGRGLRHLVFERGSVGHVWRTQRWDSFRLNTSARLNLLPGATANGHDPESFLSHLDFVTTFERYVAEHRLPVIENATVLSVEKPYGSALFKVTVQLSGHATEYYCRQVIIASGIQNEKKIPLSTLR